MNRCGKIRIYGTEVIKTNNIYFEVQIYFLANFVIDFDLLMFHPKSLILILRFNSIQFIQHYNYKCKFEFKSGKNALMRFSFILSVKTLRSTSGPDLGREL